MNEYGYYCQRCRHSSTTLVVVTGFAHARLEFCESCYDGRDGDVINKEVK